MPTPPSRDNIHQLFNEISPTYDLVNGILSFGLDSYRRKKIASLIPKQKPLRLLDLATGTGDQLFSILKRRPFITGIGIDLAEKMLQIAKTKTTKALQDHLLFQVANATSLPFEDHSFDLLTISFGIRNIPCIETCFQEMYRVLKPQGTLFILEFALPHNCIVRWGYLLYLRSMLPKLGRLISQHPHAYTYLNQTIETFPHGEAFCHLLRKQGFHTTFKRLTLGIVNLYIATK